MGVVAAGEIAAVGVDASGGFGSADFDGVVFARDEGEIGAGADVVGEAGFEDDGFVVDDLVRSLGGEFGEVGASEESPEVDDVGAEIEEGAAAEGAVADPGARAEAGGGVPADVDGFELAELAGGDAFFETGELGVTALVETGGDDAMGGGGGICHAAGVFRVERYGFFDEDVEACFEGGDAGFRVICRWRCDQDCVGGHSAEHLGDGLELGLRGQAGEGRVGIGGGDDLAYAGAGECGEMEIAGGPAAAGYGDTEGQVGGVLGERFSREGLGSGGGTSGLVYCRGVGRLREIRIRVYS